MKSVDFRNWASASQIDPLLLELLQEKADLRLAKEGEIEQTQAKPQDFSLITASYISVAVMVLIILLGVFHGKGINEILTNAFLGLLAFFGIGYCFGKILDWILNESSQALVKEVLKRTESQLNAADTFTAPDIQE